MAERKSSKKLEEELANTPLRADQERVIAKAVKDKEVTVISTKHKDQKEYEVVSANWGRYKKGDKIKLLPHVFESIEKGTLKLVR